MSSARIVFAWSSSVRSRQDGPAASAESAGQTASTSDRSVESPSSQRLPSKRPTPPPSENTHTASWLAQPEESGCWNTSGSVFSGLGLARGVGEGVTSGVGDGRARAPTAAPAPTATTSITATATSAVVVVKENRIYIASSLFMRSSIGGWVSKRWSRNVGASFKGFPTIRKDAALFATARTY